MIGANVVVRAHAPVFQMAGTVPIHTGIGSSVPMFVCAIDEQWIMVRDLGAARRGIIKC